MKAADDALFENLDFATIEEVEILGCIPFGENRRGLLTYQRTQVPIEQTALLVVKERPNVFKERPQRLGGECFEHRETVVTVRSYGC